MADVAVHDNTFLALLYGRPYVGVLHGRAPAAKNDAPRVIVEPLITPSSAALPLVAVFHGPGSQGFLDADRVLYLGGANRDGQLGLRDDHYSTFQRLTFPQPVNDVRMGYGHTIVILVDGNAYISDPDARSYRQLAVPGRVIDATLNEDGSYYLTHDGRLYALFRQGGAWSELLELVLQERPRRIYGVAHSFFFIAQDGALFLSATFPDMAFAQIITPTPVRALALGGPTGADQNRFIAALDENGVLYTASTGYHDRSFHQVELGVPVQEVAGAGRLLVYKTADEQLFVKEF